MFRKKIDSLVKLIILQVGICVVVCLHSLPVIAIDSSSELETNVVESEKKAIEVAYGYIGIGASKALPIELASCAIVHTVWQDNLDLDTLVAASLGTSVWQVMIGAEVPFYALDTLSVTPSTEFKFAVLLDSLSGRLVGVTTIGQELDNKNFRYNEISTLLPYKPTGQKILGLAQSHPEMSLLPVLAKCNGFAAMAEKISASYVLFTDHRATAKDRWIVDLQMPVMEVIDSATAARDLPITDWRFVVDGTTGQVLYSLGITKAQRLKYR